MNRLGVHDNLNLRFFKLIFRENWRGELRKKKVEPIDLNLVNFLIL